MLQPDYIAQEAESSVAIVFILPRRFLTILRITITFPFSLKNIYICVAKEFYASISHSIMGVVRQKQIRGQKDFLVF